MSEFLLVFLRILAIKSIKMTSVDEQKDSSSSDDSDLEEMAVDSKEDDDGVVSLITRVLLPAFVGIVTEN